MKRVRCTGLELPVEVLLARGIVLRVHQQSTYSGDIGRLGGALQCVLEKRLAKPDTLMAKVYSQAGQNHHRHRLLRDAFDHAGSGSCWFGTADCQTVEAHHNTRVAANIGLRAVRLLVDQRESLQELIECGLAAVKGLDRI